MLEGLLQGALGTLSLFVCSFLPGLILGVLSARFARVNFISDKPFIRLASIYSVIPLLAALFWFHYPLQSILGVVWDGFITTIIVVGLYVWASSFIITSQALDRSIKHFREAALVLDVPAKTAFKSIFMPLALYDSLHRFVNLAIITIHASMFASLLGVNELFRAAQRLNAEYLKPVEIFSYMALAYLAVCVPLLLLENFLKQKYEHIFDAA